MSFLRRLYTFDYMGHKAWWFTLSGIIIAIGLASLFIKGGGNPIDGLDYGLEFQEGSRVTVAFEGGPSLAEVRAVVAEAGYPTAQIQQTANASSGAVEGFQIQTPVLSADAQADLRTVLDERFTIATTGGKQAWGIETVSASFGRQVVSSSLKAVAIALLLILAYVTFRFQWKYAVGAIAAEVHDLLIVIGVYSLTGREVTTATIAAVLTIMGYSLYDTVIIFDRIRENEPKLGRMPYGDMVNESLWETLTRSLNTSFMSLLPVLCLLFFGGETLKDFAFALLVGIISGAYSTIFIASPVLTVLKEREPRYKKLKAAARTDEV
jgi:SecD/SecF fusion protein